MFKKFSMILALCAIVFVFSACEDNTTEPTTEEPVPAAPTNLQATSINDSTIALKWDASVDEDDALFEGYVLNITDNNGGLYAPIYPVKLEVNQVLNIESLHRATEYTFSLTAKFTNDSVSTAAVVKWATADRFTMDYYDESIRVYETASTDYGSGLDLSYEDDDNMPANHSVAMGEYWDLGIHTSNGLIFGSAAKLGYSTVTPDAVTEICKTVIMTEELSSVFDTEALSAKTFVEDVISLDDKTASFVIIVRRMDPVTSKYNYAKVLVKNVGGSFLQGTAPNRYVEFEISYQMEPGLPYAKIND